MTDGSARRADPRMRPVWTVREWVLLACSLTVLTAVLYWRTLLTDFVYDDWKVLDELHALGAINALLQHMDPRGALVYRPLGWAYFAVMSGVCGLNALPYHIVGLSLHAMNGALVAWIGERLTGAKSIGVMAAVLFVSLVSVHMECFLWFVGFYDLGALSAGLWSILLLLRGNTKASCILMACGLLIKESAAFLPILLFTIALVEQRPLRQLSWHVLVAVGYVWLKLQGVSPFSIPTEHGHAMAVSFSVAVERLGEYMSWLVSGLIPLLDRRMTLLVVVLIILWAGFAWKMSRVTKTQSIPIRRIFLIVVWVLLALLPVVFLKNQSTRYYAAQAVVPMSILASSALGEILAGLVRRRIAIVLGIIGVGVVVVCSAWFGERVFSLGLRQPVVNDGYFHLVKRAAIVEAVRDSILSRPHGLKRGASVYVNGVSLDALGGSRAVRLWFGDSTLSMVAGYPPGYSEGKAILNGEDTSTVFINLEQAMLPVPE